MKNYIIAIIYCMLCIQCTKSSKKSDQHFAEDAINFGDVKLYKTSDLIADYSFIKLESSKESLLGKISQMEVCKDKIYLLDSYSTRSLFVFSLDGKFLNKIEGLGNGPGEFMSPHSFYVNEQGYLYILDWEQSRLLKYDSDKLTFLEEIILPVKSPLSFFVLPEKDLYLYYCIPGSVADKGNKQILVADKQGSIIKEFLDVPISSKVLHGAPNNFYYFNNSVNFYPYFSDKIYTIDADSLQCKSELSFGNNKLVEKEMFTKHSESREVMEEILNTDCIRLLYIYETLNNLVVKYYIRKDFYVGVYNKRTSRNVNFKYVEVKDDLGFGGSFPLPIGTYKNQFIGAINPSDIDEKMVSDKNLKKVISGITKEDNPILVLYTMKE